jgi:hypothetical protein
MIFRAKETSPFPRAASAGSSAAEWEEAGLAKIKNGKWELYYENGGLVSINNSERQNLAVKSTNGKISGLKSENTILAAVTWGTMGRPEKLRCGTGTYLFTEDDGGRLVRVTDNAIGTAIVEISYTEKGLVSRVKRIGADGMDVMWRENAGFGRGDSFYRKPFCVEKINDARYEYTRDGNRMTLKMKPAGRVWQRLGLELKNGKMVLSD